MTCKCKNNDTNKIIFNLPNNYLSLLFPTSLNYGNRISRESNEFIQIDNNIYIAKSYIDTLDQSVIDSMVTKIRDALNQIKSSLCRCISGHIDHIKFLISDEYENQSGFIPRAWVEADCSIVYIDRGLFSNSNNIFHIIKHEIIHSLDNCSPCHDVSNKEKEFDNIKDILYRKYLNCRKQIAKAYIDIIPINVDEYSTQQQTCARSIIQKEIETLNSALSYAATNKNEFIANMLTGFCGESRTLLNPTKFSVEECFNSLPQDLKTKIQNHCDMIYNSISNSCPNLINDICNILDVYLERNSENCNKNYIGQLSISAECGISDKDGCCTAYEFFAESFSGCCDSTRNKKIKLGEAFLKPCNCFYEIQINIEALLSLINNCPNSCNSDPPYSSSREEERLNFKRYIVSLIESSFGNNSKFFLYQDFPGCK